MILRAILFGLLVSVPAILISGYIVYRGRIWIEEKLLVEIPDLAYMAVLFLAMWSAMWVTSRKVIGELSESEDPDKANRD